MFFVRTPTAVVTDLGTEFGVEVGQAGTTISQVFRGVVMVQLVGDNGQTRDVVLREGQSACVEKDKAAGGVRFVPPGAVVAPPAFVRRIVEPPKLLDLLDVVAGGDGTGNHRHRGINPVSGASCPEFTDQWLLGDQQYHSVGWHRLIDGVFVPKGGAGAVQLDSAGHVFTGFAETSGVTWGEIWSRSADFKPEEHTKCWIYLVGRRQELTPEGRGVLGLHANAGITFDLAAMRKAYAAVRPAHFQATGAIADARPWNPAADGMADVWLFVDGQLKFQRRGIRPRDGTFRLDVQIGPNDRFLTLVSTDGGNGPVCDWVVFGDPALQMVAAGSERLASDNKVRETHQDQGGAFHTPSAENRKGGPPMKQ